jgi:hypothetical protein
VENSLQFSFKSYHWIFIRICHSHTISRKKSESRYFHTKKIYFSRIPFNATSTPILFIKIVFPFVPHTLAKRRWWNRTDLRFIADTNFLFQPPLPSLIQHLHFVFLTYTYTHENKHNKNLFANYMTNTFHSLTWQLCSLIFSHANIRFPQSIIKSATTYILFNWPCVVLFVCAFTK